MRVYRGINMKSLKQNLKKFLYDYFSSFSRTNKVDTRDILVGLFWTPFLIPFLPLLIISHYISKFINEKN